MFPFIGVLLLSCATWVSLCCHKRKIEIHCTDSASSFSKFIKLLIWIFPWLRGCCLQPLNTSATTQSIGSQSEWLETWRPGVPQRQLLCYSKREKRCCSSAPGQAQWWDCLFLADFGVCMLSWWANPVCVMSSRNSTFSVWNILKELVILSSWDNTDARNTPMLLYYKMEKS